MRPAFVLLTASLMACAVLEPATFPSSEVPAPSTVLPTSPSAVTLSPPATATPTAATAAAFPDPSAYSWRPVAVGLESPVDLKNAGDDRLFVLEQHGLIRLVDGSGLHAEPFLDIRDRVFAKGNERGLLGLAFHPSFSDNGRFYVDYTGGTGNTFISRFEVGGDPNRVDPASESVVLEIDQPYPNHNGGAMAFGPDGYLYIGMGDGGSQGDPEERAQNPDSLLGKILRLDVDGGDPYAIPAGNPFAGGGGRPEIWSMGLRNPWRFAFDPSTGDLFIGDVGQNAWEEIDFLPASSIAPANFGWDQREGFSAYEGEGSPAFTDPVAVYSHAEGGCSVTGGMVVRDPSLPEWRGIYLYGDYCSGLIWGLFRDAAGAWQNRLLFSTGFRITSFGTGVDGGVYVLDRGGGVFRLSRGG